MSRIDRRLLWAVSAALGAATIAFASFSLLAVLAWLLLLIVFVRRAGGVAASGALTGFGALWTFLVLRIDTSPYPVDNAVGWALVGAVALALGLTLLVLTAVRERAREQG